MDIFIFFYVKDKVLHIPGVFHAGIKSLHEGNDDIHIINHPGFTDIVRRNMSPGIPDLLHGPDIAPLFVIDKEGACYHEPVSVQHAKKGCKIQPFDLVNIMPKYSLPLKRAQVVEHQILPPVISDLGQLLLKPPSNLLVQPEHVLIHLTDDIGSIHIFIHSISRFVSIHEVSFHKLIFHSGLPSCLSIFQ